MTVASYFFETGCLDFWEVDSNLLQIDVSTPAGNDDVPPRPIHTAALIRRRASGR
jgi:hypothetical protein